MTRRLHIAARVTIAALLLTLTLAVAWRSVNFVSATRPQPDSGTFACLGLCVLDGRVPYRDIWEQKPPMIFYLNALALGLGDGTLASIRDMERIFAVARAALFFAILYRVFGSLLLSSGASLLMLRLFYDNRVLQYGNLTEEYGSVFALTGVLLAVLAHEAPKWRVRSLAFASGLFFALAALTKEPFLLSSVPWLAYIVLKSNWKAREAGRRALSFGFGAALPVAVVSIYFLWTGAFMFWLDAASFSLGYSRHYSGGANLFAVIVGNFAPVYERVASQTVLARAAFLVGAFSVFHGPFLRRHSHFPAVALAAVAADFCGTTVSARHLGHYYMQIVASFALVAACGAWFLVYAARRASMSGFAVLFLAILVTATLDNDTTRKWAGRLSAPYSRTHKTDAITEHIRANIDANDTIWVLNGAVSRYYVETGAVCPTRLDHGSPSILKDTLLNSGKRKRSLLLARLRQCPPKFVIVAYPGSPKEFGFAKWLHGAYAFTGVKHANIMLYEHKGDAK